MPPGPPPDSGNQPEGLGIDRPRTRLTVSEQEKRQLQPRFIGNMPASHRRPVRARVMPLALTRPERPPRARSPEQDRRHQAHGNIFPGVPAAHLRHRRAKIIYLNRHQPDIPANQAHTGTMSPEVARVTETRRANLNAERNVTLCTTGRPTVPGASCAGHRQSLIPRNVQLEIQRKTSLGIGQVHREPTVGYGCCFTRVGEPAPGGRAEPQHGSAAVLGVAHEHAIGVAGAPTSTQSVPPFPL